MVSNGDEKENQDRKCWNLETKVQYFLSVFTLRRVHPSTLKCRKQMFGLAEKNYEKYRDLQKQKDTLRRRRRQLANEMVEVKQVTSVSLVSVQVTVANKNVVDLLLIRKRLNRFKLFDDNKYRKGIENF